MANGVNRILTCMAKIMDSISKAMAYIINLPGNQAKHMDSKAKHMDSKAKGMGSLTLE